MVDLGEQLKKNIRQAGDYVLLNGKPYNGRSELHMLPKELSVEKAFTRESEKGTIFQGEHSFLSNFHAREVRYQGKTYNCNEQAFFHVKAQLCGDPANGEAILKETDPRKIKNLGREIKDTEPWLAQRVTILKDINIIKYQDEEMKAKLLATGTKPIWECSGDGYWGVGVHLLSKEVNNTRWKGQNVFGQMLMEIRREIRSA